MKNLNKKPLAQILIRDFKQHKYKYLIMLPVIILLFIFRYKPMYGIIIAFQEFRPSAGIANSPWVGLAQFKSFFNDVYFWRILRNTFLISLGSIIFTFPAPILLALLLNEVKCIRFKRFVQTITYMPHFISIVVICSMIVQFTMSNGLIADIIVFFGGERVNVLSKKEYFHAIYYLSGIWQGVGWGSIIYLAALSGIDQELYEAAKIDGAGRLQQIWHITLPGILPTVSTLLVLRLGSILSADHEKILLLYQPLTYEVADVISTYVYRKGMLDASYSYSTAVGLFNSFVNIVFLVMANKFSKKVGQSGLF